MIAAVVAVGAGAVAVVQLILDFPSVLGMRYINQDVSVSLV